MDSKYLLMFLVLIISLVLIVSFGLGLRVSYATGTSMTPAYDDDCTIVFGLTSQSGDFEEGDIAVYESVRGDSKYIIHRIDTIYKSYNADTADYKVDRRNGELVITDGMRYAEIGRTEGELSNLENERLYIFKGDNNTWIDPEFVTQEQVKFKVLSPHVELPDNTGFICGYQGS